MDSVKRAIEGVGGTLDISSVTGKGTRFTLSLPLTVAVVNLLLVGVGNEVFGLPLARVSGVVEASGDSLSRTQTSRMLSYGNALVPVYGLAELLEVPAPPPVSQALARPWVVVDADGGPIALGVDTLLGQEEVVLKALQRPLDLVPGLAGVTILGSGRPIFILDVARLVT
jgi:two-component system chemotaxis sensor kinase CheA